jgi:hypothetical protein
VNTTEIEHIVSANIDKTVCVVYADGTTEKLLVLLVHTVDDEGFVCDSATKTGQQPPYAYCVRFIDIREVRAEGSEPEEK